MARTNTISSCLMNPWQNKRSGTFSFKTIVLDLGSHTSCTATTPDDLLTLLAWYSAHHKMADRRRAELAEAVTEACESLDECGFLGLMETPVLKTFTDLHKMNDSERVSKLLLSMDGAAARLVSTKAAPSFPELMVASTLLGDIEGPAAPPEGADSPLSADFRSLASHLRVAIVSALTQFARPGSEEAEQGLPMAAGMLLMLHDKLAGDTVLALAAEHAMLRLLRRNKSCVLVLRDRSWSLAALNNQVAALADYKPKEGAEGEEADEDVEEADDDDDEFVEDALDEEEDGDDDMGAGDDGEETVAAEEDKE